MDSQKIKAPTQSKLSSIMLLKEYETLRSQITSKGNHRLQLLYIISSVHLIALGIALEQKTGDLLFFVPVFTSPLYLYYIYEYLEEAIMRKYIKQELEKKKCGGYKGWEHYWFNAECVEAKNRKHTMILGWKYTQIPIWWLAGISYIPSFMLYISNYLLLWPTIKFLFSFEVYSVFIIIYVFFLAYIGHTVTRLMRMFFSDIGYS